MHMRPLGHTGLSVSLICLGTMTYGEQNTAAEAFEQMDYALDQGVNFFDTAELYAIPPKAETQGKTEEIVGDWIAARKTRDKVILATKIVGAGSHLDWIRGGNTRHDRAGIDAAVESSLARLKTDYIDLYQLHWPMRPVNSFGRRNFDFTTVSVANADKLLETLHALDMHVKAGRIRHIGLSNETAWGVMTFLRLAKEHGLPRVASVQNPYNLLNRSYETALAEVSMQENVGLLAYSPLARGTLTGKYLNGQLPPASSRAIDSRKSRYDLPNGEKATAAYVDIARRHNIDPAQMAIAYVNAKPFVTSNIIGATTMDNLRMNIAAAAITLPDDILREIEAVHADIPNPCP